MSRYYGQQQQYAPLDEPDAAVWNPHIDEPAYSHSASASRDRFDHYPEQEADEYPLNQSARGIHYPPPKYDNYNPLKGPAPRSRWAFIPQPWTKWDRKRKFWIFGGIAVLILIIIIAIAVGVAVAHSSFSYTPSFKQVTNDAAFTSGGATHNSVNDTSDGVGAGQDTYTYYTGGPENFPASTSWVSFEDMWQNNLNTLKTSCGTLGVGPDNTPEQIQYIYDAIQDRANASLVDHRFIFAVILQESNGCIHVGQTTSTSGVSNPGLMQSHNGDAFSSSSPRLSILAMVQDGTQGTDAGAGLVQNLNLYGDPYSAARGYNSGYIPKSGDLSEAAGATACYVTDIANRLTGWVREKSTCPGD